MSKVAIVTDSTAYLPDNLVAAYNITVAPLVVIWGEETLQDNIDITPTAFYERLSQAKVMPTTSQATIQTFADIFKELHAEGYEILTVVISSALSGTLDSAQQAKKMVPEATIELIDSKYTSVPLAYIALSAARAAKRGATLAECKAIAETVRDHAQVYFAVDTLEFLHRGGRIGGAARFLGTALQLKPILKLEDGKIDAFEKVRTARKAHNRLLDLLENHLSEASVTNMIGVVGAAADEAAEYLLSEIKARFNPNEIMLANLSPVIGTHTGPGTVGVAFVADVDPELIKA
jgi:DegV family protein with EDD domain